MSMKLVSGKPVMLMDGSGKAFNEENPLPVSTQVEGASGFQLQTMQGIPIVLVDSEGNVISADNPFPIWDMSAPVTPAPGVTMEIGTVATGAAGSDAAVTMTWHGDEAVLNFVIPRGQAGVIGPDGAKGNQGVQGDIGSQGVQGLKGDKGDKGDQGVQGPKGDQGIQGIQGVQGLKGDVGATGAVGAVGPQGAQGAQGDRGSKGLTGDVGPQGPIGLKGDQGDAGATGFTGATGAVGPAGSKGDKGDKGDPGSAGASGAAGAVGATGSAGAAGTSGAAASVAVGIVTTGAAGSSVVVTNSGTSSAAVLNFSIPKGAAGNDGAAGVSPTLAAVASTPTRVLGTVFQPSTTKIVDVFYTGLITCTSTLAGGQNGKIELLSDAVNPPTTVRGRISNANSVALAIALTAVNTQESMLSYRVPVGHYVKLVATQTLGSPAISLTLQSEVTVS